MSEKKLGTCDWSWHKVPHEYGEDCLHWREQSQEEPMRQEYPTDVTSPSSFPTQQPSQFDSGMSGYVRAKAPSATQPDYTKNTAADVQPEAGEKPHDVIVLSSDIRWQFRPASQYFGLYECEAVDPSGNIYHPVTTPSGRILLRKVSI